MSYCRAYLRPASSQSESLNSASRSTQTSTSSLSTLTREVRTMFDPFPAVGQAPTDDEVSARQQELGYVTAAEAETVASKNVGSSLDCSTSRRPPMKTGTRGRSKTKGICGRSHSPARVRRRG